MAWELRLRGWMPARRDEDEVRYVKEAVGRLVNELRARGHHLEVSLNGPDGTLAVYEARPTIPQE